MIILQGEYEKQHGIYYQLDPSQKPVGEGGMGSVYIGYRIDQKSNSKRTVAIKCIYDDLPPHVIERARRESTIMLRNDNLVEMLGFVQTTDGSGVTHAHVVSELLTGVSLSDIMKGKTTDRDGNEIDYAVELKQLFNKNPEVFARTIIINVLSGVMALHDAGFIHRDIDPSNIMVTKDRHIKLIDFGIAKKVSSLTTNDRGLTMAGGFLGKPEYAAPELVLGDLRHQNQTTDIYAIGILLYQLIVGQTPFKGAGNDILDMQLHQKIPVQNVKDKQLRQIIAKACEKTQAKRYQSCAEMRVAIEQNATASASGKTFVGDVAEKTTGISKKAKLIITTCVATTIVAASLLLVLVNRDDEESLPEPSSVQQTALSHEVDSLKNIVSSNLTAARKEAAIGMQHGEGYVDHLIVAKEHFMAAAKDINILQQKGQTYADNTKEVSSVDSALVAAKYELQEKATMLSNSGEHDAAEVFNKQIQRISSLLQYR